jgi:hypothetical protein
MTDSIKHFTGFDISGKSEAELFDAAKGMGIDVDATMGKGKLIDEILELNAKETIFNRLSLQIIQRKCHHCVNNTETILN